MKLITTFLLSLFLFISPIAQAHKIKTAFTIVLFNDRTNNIEVVHRFYLHDAEEAVWELFDKNADIIASEQTQAIFALYVENKFALKDQNEQIIELETLGFQNEDGYFWVYQEAPIPAQLSKLSLKHEALKDVWSEQFNVVNVEGLAQIHTLHFSDNDSWLSININPEKKSEK